MDGQRFDTLSRFLAGGNSRRGALRLAGAALLGGGLLCAADADARGGNANKKKCDQAYKECDDLCDAGPDDERDLCEATCKIERDACRGDIKACEELCDSVRAECRAGCGKDDGEESDGPIGQCRKTCNQDRKECRNLCRGR